MKHSLHPMQECAALATFLLGAYGDFAETKSVYLRITGERDYNEGTALKGWQLALAKRQSILRAIGTLDSQYRKEVAKRRKREAQI